MTLPLETVSTVEVEWERECDGENEVHREK